MQDKELTTGGIVSELEKRFNGTFEVTVHDTDTAEIKARCSSRDTAKVINHFAGSDGLNISAAIPSDKGLTLWIKTD